jgi:phosphoserine phosphatase
MKLIVFDVDGTLIDTGIGSFKDIGMMLGKDKEIKEHAAEYEKRKHLGPWGLEELAMIFKGIDEKEIKRLAEKIVKEKLMSGAKETILKLKEKGYLLVSYSSSPIWIMKVLKQEFGFQDVCGNVLEVKDGKITGRLLGKVDRYVKAERLKKFMKENKISKENTFIVGDSVTDLPMAEHGHFIAFNCKKQEVRKKAEYIIDKKDLREILKYIN